MMRIGRIAQADSDSRSPVASSTGDAVHAQPRAAPSGKAQRLDVIPSLDGIRAISVLIVVLGHSNLQSVVPDGLGVTIFFFLSGYLISTLMIVEHERTGRLNIKHFYARRMLRLMPPLLITLVVAYTLTYVGWLAGA